jgi:hypothetical protein
MNVKIPGEGLVNYPNGSVAVLEVKGYTGPIKQVAKEKSVSKKASAVDKDDTEYPWATWGTNDNYPQTILKNNADIGVILRGIEINADIHYGNGLMLYKETYNDGKRVMEGFVPPWFNELRRSLYLEEIQSEVVESLATMDIAFIEIVPTKAKNAVASAQVLDFCHTRFKKRDKAGNITSVYYHPDIGATDVSLNVKDVIEIPYFDPTWEKTDIPDKFVIALSHRTFNRNYYPEPNYTASHRNGWADVAKKIPKLISSIYENQMVVKYHCIVDIGVFRARYKCWDNPPNSETEEKIMDWQLEKIQEFTNSMNEHLTKPENAGKAIVTLRDEMDKIGVELKPIQNFLDSTKELPNAAAANSEMLFVDGVDPTLVGHGIPGASNLSGSGSDKREAAKLKQSTLKRSRIISLKWLYIIGSMFYGLKNDEFIAYMDIDISQTLDENPTGKKQTAS